MPHSKPTTPSAGQPAMPYGPPPPWGYPSPGLYLTGYLAPPAPEPLPTPCRCTCRSRLRRKPRDDHPTITTRCSPCPTINPEATYVFHPDTTHFQVFAVNPAKGTSFLYKTVFSTRHTAGAAMEAWAAPTNTTVAALIRALGGSPEKTHLVEAEDRGDGRWTRGQVVFGDGEDGMKGIGEVGWTERRGREDAPVYLVLSKGRKKG